MSKLRQRVDELERRIEALEAASRSAAMPNQGDILLANYTPEWIAEQQQAHPMLRREDVLRTFLRQREFYISQGKTKQGATREALKMTSFTHGLGESG